MALRSKYPGLTGKDFWEKWDTVDVQNAMKFARLEKSDIDYIFVKKRDLGDSF